MVCICSLSVLALFALIWVEIAKARLILIPVQSHAMPYCLGGTSSPETPKSVAAFLNEAPDLEKMNIFPSYFNQFHECLDIFKKGWNPSMKIWFSTF